MDGLIGGRWRTLELLDHDASTEVHTAEDVLEGGAVTLLVYRGEDGDRILREARALLAQPHAHLPQLTAAVGDHDRVLIAYRPVDGEPIGRAPLPPHRVLAVASDIAGALDHLQTLDPPISHRGVSPPRLIRASDGGVVLAGPWWSHDLPEARRGGGAIAGLAAAIFSLLTGDEPDPRSRGWSRLPADGSVARVLASAIAGDEPRTHLSAGALVDELRWMLAPTLPEGVVTFLLTDVEGSTRLWEEEPAAMAQALERNLEIITDEVARAGGVLIKSKGEGDSTFAAFARASDAIPSALAIQRRLHAEPWPTSAPLRTRIAVHTGEATSRDGDYFGPTVNRAARIRSVAHGGQTLISGAAHRAADGASPQDASFVDLGLHRLKDLTTPERLYELRHAELPRDFPPLRSLDAASHNLPIQLTNFIGREAEMAEIRDILARARTVTVTGTGGVGKTRLALQVAADIVGRFEHGVWLIEFAPLEDPSLVLGTIASALGVTESPGTPMERALIEHVRSRSLLLMLDNCEHLIDEVARVAHVLMQNTVDVRILATSREPLRIPGEVVWRAPSLPVPSDAEPAASEAERSEAVQLFFDRAALARAGQDPRDIDLNAVAEITRRLDGIPLAIELAASAVHSLSAPEIAKRLHDRFALLTGGPRTALPRQRTLEATIAWSYDLLSPAERELLEDLSIFTGGWSLETAEEVAPAPGRDVATGLVALVDRSLVQVDERHGRYSLLETIHAFARARLARTTRLKDLRERHLLRMMAFIDEACAAIKGADQVTWLARIDAEKPNLLAALGYALDQRRIEDVGSFVAALNRYWLVRNLYREGLSWVERVLALPGISPPDRMNTWAIGLTLVLRIGDRDRIDDLLTDIVAAIDRGDTSDADAGILSTAANACFNLGMIRRSLELHERCLTIRRRAGDPIALARTLANLSLVLMAQGRAEEALPLSEEARAICIREGDVRGEAFASNGVLTALAALDQLDEALPLAARSEELARQIGDTNLLITTLGLRAVISQSAGRTAEAWVHLDQGEALAVSSGNRSRERWIRLQRANVSLAAGMGGEAGAIVIDALRDREIDALSVANRLEVLGRIRIMDGHAALGALLFGAADRIFGETGGSVTGTSARAHEAARARALDILGAEAFDAAIADGKSLSLDEAVARALADAPSSIAR